MVIKTSIAVGLLFVAFFVFVVVMRTVRRSRPPRDAPPIQGFAMADLHQLYQQGELSAEEFERAKQSLIARTPEALTKNAAGAFPVLPVEKHAARDE